MSGSVSNKLVVRATSTESTLHHSSAPRVKGICGSHHLECWELQQACCHWRSTTVVSSDPFHFLTTATRILRNHGDGGHNELGKKHQQPTEDEEQKETCRETNVSAQRMGPCLYDHTAAPLAESPKPKDPQKDGEVS
eukprot:4340598-Prymnesium_polylepis.1